MAIDGIKKWLTFHDLVIVVVPNVKVMSRFDVDLAFSMYTLKRWEKEYDLSVSL